MTFSTRTTLVAGFIAFAALLSACDSAPQTPVTQPVPADDFNPPPASTSVMEEPPTAPPGVSTTPAPTYSSTTQKIDYTEVIRYIKSEARLAQYRDVFDNVVRNILNKMQQEEMQIPHVEEQLPDPRAALESLPRSTSPSLVPKGEENSNPLPNTKQWPEVAMTFALIDGKPNFSEPLEIRATLLDGTKLVVKRVDDVSKIPFSGDVTIAGVNTNIGTDNGTQADFGVKIMDATMYGDNLTVDAVKMADRIILKKLQEVGELQGSDWY